MRFGCSQTLQRPFQPLISRSYPSISCKRSWSCAGLGFASSLPQTLAGCDHFRYHTIRKRIFASTNNIVDLKTATRKFLEDNTPFSTPTAAHLLEQSLSTRPKLARAILMRWLEEPEIQPGDVKILRECFHRVLYRTDAPDAYELFRKYQATGLPVTSQAIAMVSERMAPEQWDDQTIHVLLSALDQELEGREVAQNAFLRHVPWTGDQAQTYLESNIAEPTSYSYSAVIQKYIMEGNTMKACAVANTAANAVTDVTACVNLCMLALAKDNRADEVERLFQTLSSPNEHSYAALLQALPPEHGHSYLLDSERDCGIHAYGIVMNKFAKQDNMGPIVEELLGHAGRRYPTDDLVVLKGIAISAWKNTSTWEASDRATAIYMTVDQPNTALTTALLQVWAKSNRPDAGERCATIFQSMVNQGTATVTAYNLVLSAQTAEDAWEMLQAQTSVVANAVLRPNAASWATVLARPGHSVERIYEIVSHYKECLRKKQRNDAIVFVQAVLALPSASHAHAFVLAETQSNRDYTEVHLVLLRRWSRSHDAVAPERADEIAGWIKEKNSSADVNTVVQQLLVDAWSRSRRQTAIGRVQALESELNQMQQLL